MDEGLGTSLPKKISQRLVFAVILMGVIVLLGVIGVTWLLLKPPQPLPNTITHAVHFQLYYPSRLPRGYSFDGSSPKQSDGIVYYKLRNDADSKKTLTLTFQATPSNFDTRKFSSSMQSPIPSTLTPLGIMYNLSAGQQSEYLLLSNESTMIFIYGQTTIPSDVINSLASSLSPIH